jgi:hypothetical protein
MRRALRRRVPARSVRGSTDCSRLAHSSDWRYRSEGLLVPPDIYTQEIASSINRMRRIFEPAGLLVRGWRIRGFELALRFMSIDHMDDSAFLYVRSIRRDPVREAMSLPVNWESGVKRGSSNDQG